MLRVVAKGVSVEVDIARIVAAILMTHLFLS
jgi:hypothetical protein